MKEVELKLISELIRNSRRSDRELARAIGVSQPTVSRLTKKLEKEGVIKEYTIIPDFTKLGFEIMCITFVKRSKEISAEEFENVRKIGEDAVEKGMKNIMTMRGLGLGHDVVIISVHEDYTSFLTLLADIRQFPYADVTDIQTFVISLSDKIQYRPLTFSPLARYIRTLNEKKK